MKTMFMVALIKDEVGELQEVHLHRGKEHNAYMLDMYGRKKIISCIATNDRALYHKGLVEARIAVYRDLEQRYNDHIEMLVKEDYPASVIADTKRLQDDYLESQAEMIGSTVRRYYLICNNHNKDIADLDELAVQFYNAFQLSVEAA